MSIPGSDKSEHCYTIYLVDDEEGIEDVISLALEDMNVRISTFKCGEDCLRKLTVDDCSLLITDVKMRKINGLHLMQRAKELRPWLPVVMITGHGNIPMAVHAIKMGASDFIEKPIKPKRLLRTVKTLLDQKAVTQQLLGNTLTKTEMAVLPLIAEGLGNQMIAHKFHRSARTIEHHRQHIMCKLKVSNLAELVTRLHALGLMSSDAANSDEGDRHNPNESVSIDT